ncbi:MAG: hypothetical protein JSV32_07375 [Dehalococcoidia bacterium]|nr:MAG: hypothetical protein JSV32_07375 [Dehalococcoidia bacterium]
MEIFANAGIALFVTILIILALFAVVPLILVIYGIVCPWCKLRGGELIRLKN